MAPLLSSRLQIFRLLVRSKDIRSRYYKLNTITYNRYYSQMKGLVLGVYTEKSDNGNELSEVTEAFKDVDGKCNGKLSAIVKATGPFCKSVKHKLLWVPTITEAKLDFDCVSVVDLGAKECKKNPLECVEENADRVRCAIAGGVKTLRSSSDFEDIFIDPCCSAKGAAEAATLVLFSYDCLKDPSSCRKKSNIHLYKYSSIPKECVEDFDAGVQVAECQNFGRYLMEAPANHMTPSIFASTVSEKLKDTNIKVIVREQDWIESMKMGSFLSVSRGSAEKPKFVELHYEGAPQVEKCVALVGKGITFDSGGISIKPSLNMDAMRADMGGAACVVSTILGASRLKLKLNIKGFIPLTENMPGGKATKPGDVVRAMNGKTIQVDNTDAEGRLVLADALCYAQTFKPIALLDMATLTGAIRVALGDGATGVFSNDEALWDALNKASHVSGDRVWRLPLYECYKKAMKGFLADLNNLGQKGAGSCTAAAFLSEFVEPDTKWMHLDIAGVMECDGQAPYMSKGMTARPTRTLVQFLKQMEGEF